MPVKRDNDDAVTGEQSHIVDDRQEVGVHIDLELRLKVKAVLMEEPGIEGIVAGHCLDLGGIQHHSFSRLRDVYEADTGKPSHILTRL